MMWLQDSLKAQNRGGDMLVSGEICGGIHGQHDGMLRRSTRSRETAGCLMLQVV